MQTKNDTTWLIRTLRNGGIIVVLMSLLALVSIYTIGNYALGPFTMYGDPTEHLGPPADYPTQEYSKEDLKKRFGVFRFVSTSVKLFWIVLKKCETPDEAEAITQRLRFCSGVVLSGSVVLVLLCLVIGHRKIDLTVDS